MGENWRHQWDKSGVISEGNLASWVGEIWRDWLEKSGVIGEEISLMGQIWLHWCDTSCVISEEICFHWWKKCDVIGGKIFGFFNVLNLAS